jgi:hypothetical protein
MDASMVDTWQLEKLVTEGKLPNETIKKLAEFARKEKVQRIYLNKKK